MATSTYRKKKNKNKEADHKFFLYVFFFHIFNSIGKFFHDLLND
tara:strand:- start:456 stop:587 length:132 start_codon:yes stop_codon:yes gene_type:complete